MGSDGENKIHSQTISFQLHDEKIIFDYFRIVYSDYGHEHVSYGPDEPFAATTGVYYFLFSENKDTESVVIYQDRNEAAEPLLWKKYLIVLISASANQQEVVLKISIQ
jgi:hypothetical protein